MRLLYFPIVETGRYASVEAMLATVGITDRRDYDRLAACAAAEPCDVIVNYEVLFDDPVKQWRPAYMPQPDGSVVAGVAMLGEGRPDLAEVERFVDTCFKADPGIAGTTVHIRALPLVLESALQ